MPGSTVSASEVFGVTRGCQLRRLRQGAGLRQQHLALAPPYVPSLEPEHPACAYRGGRDAEARERLHLVHQGRQGLALTQPPPLSAPAGRGDPHPRAATAWFAALSRSTSRWAGFLPYPGTGRGRPAGIRPVLGDPSV